MSVGDMALATSRGNAESGFEVLLYVYDLSKGLAKKLSPALLGKELPGVWHTSIVVRGTEYFFGSTGIDSCPAGKTTLQIPDQVISLGRTELPHDVFLEYIDELGKSTYKGSTYNLFRHNCNNFSQDVAMFLTGKSIPREILELPGRLPAHADGQHAGAFLRASRDQCGQGAGTRLSGRGAAKLEGIALSRTLGPFEAQLVTR
ncbi:hypothetical protein MRX96_033042 [Rhipicephalus microplus]